MTRDDALSLFSKGFSSFLKRNSFTLEHVGNLLGCSKANVSNIRNGKTSPSFENVLTLVENGMTLEEVFGKELSKKMLASARQPSPGSPLERAQYVRAGLKDLLRQLTDLDESLPDIPENRNA